MLLRLSAKGAFSEGMAFENGGGREMKTGARRAVEQRVTAFVHNFLNSEITLRGRGVKI